MHLMREYTSHPYPIAEDDPVNNNRLIFLKETTLSLFKDIIKNATEECGVILNENLEEKVGAVLTELLSNVYKYEKSKRFKLSIKMNEGALGIHFYVPGEELDVEKLKRRIYETELDISRGIQPLGKMGLYYIKKFSDHFDIKKINNEWFNVEFEILFSIKFSVTNNTCM